jgi:nucleoid-associated protein YgaU
MADFARVAVRSPQPFDIVGDTFSLCGLGGAVEGVVGTAALKDNNGTVLATVSPMFVPNSGFLFTLFDFPVLTGTPVTPEGVLTVDADNPSGLPENEFRVTVPVTFGRTLLGGASYAGFLPRRVVAGDTLSGIAQDIYGDGDLWPRLFVANRDRISDPDLIRVGQVLRIPMAGA